MMDKVYNQAFDMRPVIVLISHDHDWAVAEGFEIFVFKVFLQPNDFKQVFYFLILHNLLSVCLPNI